MRRILEDGGSSSKPNYKDTYIYNLLGEMAENARRSEAEKKDRTEREILDIVGKGNRNLFGERYNYNMPVTPEDEGAIRILSKPGTTVQTGYYNRNALDTLAYHAGQNPNYNPRILFGIKHRETSATGKGEVRIPKDLNNHNYGLGGLTREELDNLYANEKGEKRKSIKYYERLNQKVTNFYNKYKNAYDHAIDYYSRGMYNTNANNNYGYNKLVMEDGKNLMSSKEFQKYWKERGHKEYLRGYRERFNKSYPDSLYISDVNNFINNDDLFRK